MSDAAGLAKSYQKSIGPKLANDMLGLGFFAAYHGQLIAWPLAT
jgi:hypothetical protein